MIYTPLTDEVGMRLDAYLAKVSGESRSAAVRAINEGRVKISGVIPDKKYAVRAGDEVEFLPDEPEE